ncbi:MAG: ectoine hydroxylase-related dioxygenase (phytanoyl-CoA dioxygenase family) [Lysobacterales bacterium]|jgi:ectoine hydroxylase-related dioxygenase (phytanoyl-CoA dioxygenase family)
MDTQIDLAQYPLEAGSLPKDAIEKAVHMFRVHGTLLIKNVFPTEMVQLYQDEFRKEYESLPQEEVHQSCMEVGDKRYMFTIKLKEPFNDPGLYASQRLLPILNGLLGTDCAIQSFGAVCAYPGAEMQHYHKDHPALFTDAGGINAFLPPYALHVVIPLIDLNEQCGTTAVWPGSHRKKIKREMAKPGISEADMLKGATLPYPKMGDCFLMDFRLGHRGTANRSNHARTILYLVYSRVWFQDHTNFNKQIRLDIDEAELEKIPQQHRGLFINVRLDSR